MFSAAADIKRDTNQRTTKKNYDSRGLRSKSYCYRSRVDGSYAYSNVVSFLLTYSKINQNLPVCKFSAG